MSKLGLFRKIISTFQTFKFSVYRFLWNWAQQDLTQDLADDFEQIDPKTQVTHHYLKTTLEKFPYWGYGHLYYAKLCLDLRKTSNAYIAIQSAKILGVNAEQLQFLEARIYLLSGKPKEALSLLDQLEGSDEIFEYRSAALLALKRYDQAKAELLCIPEDSRTQEMNAALLYLQQKSP